MPSTFYDILRSDRFIITAEVSPPKGVDTSAMLADAALLKGWVDAINITDNQRAVVRMSPLAAGKRLLDEGHEVIMQLTCRDRNRLALQSDLLGASAMGIRNVCVMSGDHTTKGDHPGAKPVYDLDSIQLLAMIRNMEEGYDLAGNELEDAPQFVFGAVSNTDPTQPMQLLKFKKKVRMGAQFIQTQAVYDVEQFAGFMNKIRELGVPEVPVIAGIIPLRSANMARFMNENIPGIRVGDDLIHRMDDGDDPVQEGVRIAAETITKLRGMCRGVHLMPIRGHVNTPQLLEMAGLAALR